MIVLTNILSGLSLLMSGLYLIKLKYPSFILLMKLLSDSLPPYWAILGVNGAVLGWFLHAPLAIAMGIIGAGTMIWYVWRNTREQNGFEKAFGAG